MPTSSEGAAPRARGRVSRPVEEVRGPFGRKEGCRTREGRGWAGRQARALGAKAGDRGAKAKTGRRVWIVRVSNLIWACVGLLSRPLGGNGAGRGRGGEGEGRQRAREAEGGEGQRPKKPASTTAQQPPLRRRLQSSSALRLTYLHDTLQLVLTALRSTMEVTHTRTPALASKKRSPCPTSPGELDLGSTSRPRAVALHLGARSLARLPSHRLSNPLSRSRAGSYLRSTF